VPDIQGDAAPYEVCVDGPRDVPENIHAQEMPELKDIHALQIAASASTDMSHDVSPDIIAMERAVGQLIRDAGNPAERDLYDMLKKLKHRYTWRQIRMWKQHFGGNAEKVSVMEIGQTASSSSAAAQFITNEAEVPADIAEMNNDVGEFIRRAGNRNERKLYEQLKEKGCQYTRKQVRLWKQHYGVTEPVDGSAGPSAAGLKDIDAEIALSQYRDDVVFCMNLGDGYKRLMKRLLNHGVRMTEHQARLALIQVKYTDLPQATWEQWEEFTDVLAKGGSREAMICDIAEARGWSVSLRTMGRMREEYDKQLTVAQLEQRYGELLRRRINDVAGSYGHGVWALKTWLESTYKVTCSRRVIGKYLKRLADTDIDSCVGKMIDMFETNKDVTADRVPEGSSANFIGPDLRCFRGAAKFRDPPH